MLNVYFLLNYFSKPNKTQKVIINGKMWDYVPDWIEIIAFVFWSSVFSFFFFFFGFHAFQGVMRLRFMHYSWTVATFVDFSTVNSAPVHCSRIYKFHFSATFSLKIGPTALFTHLKIILLQCFQFLVLAK